MSYYIVFVLSFLGAMAGVIVSAYWFMESFTKAINKAKGE